MNYIVTERFADLEDGKRIYEAGETYPRPGHSVSAERVALLAGRDNRMGRPLIKAVEKPIEVANVTDDKEAKPGRKTRNKAVSARLRG